MGRYKIFLITALVFISLSGLIYFVHYLVFRDIRHIFIYMVGDLAFVPLEVFLVVIIIERILKPPRETDHPPQTQHGDLFILQRGGNKAAPQTTPLFHR